MSTDEEPRVETSDEAPPAKCPTELREKRLRHIIMKREQGQSYEQISKGLEKAGFGANVTKVRVETLIKQNRPDLMGSVMHRRYKGRE